MRDGDLRVLSAAVSRHIGYLGTRKAQLGRIKIAEDAAEASGLGAEITERSNDSLLAILDAAAQAAQESGRDVGAFRLEVDKFRGHDQDRDAVGDLNKAARRALGWRRHRWVGPASLGTALAVVAVLTWDLAASDGAYTPEIRRELVRPWLAVATLPEGLQP